MPTDEKHESAAEDLGSYIMIGGVKRTLVPSQTEFSVDVPSRDLRTENDRPDWEDVQQLAIGRSRVIIKDPSKMESVIGDVRSDPEKAVHRIYRVAGTGEELNITDTIYLTLRQENHDAAKALADEYKLDLQEERGNTYTLKVTCAARRNPLKIANEIASREDVVSCTPKILFPIRFGDASPAHAVDIEAVANRHPLFKKQWHLSTEGMRDESLDLLASINAPRAWEIAGSMGKPEIVIAVIDDGFDMPDPTKPEGRHNAFRETIVDIENMKNFDTSSGEPDKNIASNGTNFHGTPVASIIAASGQAMLGVAPGCTLLPVRIGSSLNMDPNLLLKIIGEVAPFADVINCSFSMTPQSLPLITNPPTFIEDLREVIKGGKKRQGKGVVVVFSAGNDDAPISMSAAENEDGIVIVENRGTLETSKTIGPREPVHCGFSELSGGGIPDGPIPGVVVVGAMSSLRRRAGYSNWGEELTLVAPSDNGHELTRIQPDGETKVRARFPGVGVVAAINRFGNGGTPRGAPPMQEDPATPTIFESFLYTGTFGGTSAAAAIVSGVIGLMLSVNPDLTAEQVVRILKETAADEIDENRPFDFVDDPNLLGVEPASLKRKLFGSGKVDAAEAVRIAKG